jgi:hypothetical protein
MPRKAALRMRQIHADKTRHATILIIMTLNDAKQIPIDERIDTQDI